MASPTNSHVRHLTADAFDDTVRSTDQPVLVDFWAEWCPPCHAIAPTIEALATDLAGVAVVSKVNVDEAPQLAARFGVESIPTLVVLKGGAEVKRLVGARPRAEIEGILRALASTPAATGRPA